MTGFAPAAKRVSSSPDSTRPGIGSPAANRVSLSTGSGSGLATSTRFPNLRPRSTPASAMRATCGNTARTVATCARACVSGAPSATLTANTPLSLSTRRAANRRAVHREVGSGIAELVPDLSRTGSWLLFIDGTPQSQVDLDDPGYLEFEYVRRLGHVLDTAAPPAQPLRVLHLGAGTLTLARYVAATRPGSRQAAVDIDASLVELVRVRLPLRRVRVRVGDARAVHGGREAGQRRGRPPLSRAPCGCVRVVLARLARTRTETCTGLPSKPNSSRSRRSTNRR